MKIPFNIKFRPQIESGEYKVETKGGLPVEIVKWDLRSLHGSSPILAIIHGNYDYNRTYSDRGYSTIYSDKLFIVTPEPELNEFEKAIKDLVLTIDEGELRELGVFEEENLGAWAVKKAGELLKLARNEIVKSGYAIVESEHYLEEGRKNYERGKEEAMKDLPRWERLYSKENADKIPDCIVPGKALDNRLVHRGFELNITDLEKLPGFNE